MYDATLVDGYLKGGTEPANRSPTLPGVSSGDAIYAGECILTNYSLSSPVGEG